MTILQYGLRNKKENTTEAQLEVIYLNYLLYFALPLIKFNQRDDWLWFSCW